MSHDFVEVPDERSSQLREFPDHYEFIIVRGSVSVNWGLFTVPITFTIWVQ